MLSFFIFFNLLSMIKQVDFKNGFYRNWVITIFMDFVLRKNTLNSCDI